MEVAREFMESSTIHGLVYIATKQRLIRLSWICVVIAGFTGAAALIRQSFSSWASSPISTTIETLPISDLDFPNVTVCPPRNSLTSLNPDLLSSRNITLDEAERLRLVSAAVFDGVFSTRYPQFAAFRQQKYINWYRGISREFIKYDKNEDYEIEKKYHIETTDLSGTVSTPHFGQLFDEKIFELDLTWVFTIFLPDNLTEGTSLLVDFHFDSEKEFHVHLAEKVNIQKTNIPGKSEEFYQQDNITFNQQVILNKTVLEYIATGIQ